SNTVPSQGRDLDKSMRFSLSRYGCPSTFPAGAFSAIEKSTIEASGGTGFEGDSEAQQQAADYLNVFMIQLERSDGRPSRSRLPLQNNWGLHGPLKMIGPHLHSRVEQKHLFLRGRVNGRCMSPFVGITVRAGQSEIGQFGQAALAPRQDM